MYAEHFTNSASREISEVLINISKANFVLASDSVRIYVFDDGPIPGKILASRRIWMNEVKDTFLLKVDFDKTVPVTGNFYIGWRIWYGSRAILETRQFAVFHSPDRILPALNTGWFHDSSGWKTFLQHPFKPMSVSLDVEVVTVGNSALNEIREIKSPKDEFTVYPNPTNDFIIISSKNEIQEIKFSLTDLAGINIRSGHLVNRFPGDFRWNISDLKPGIYLLNLNNPRISESHKILITR
jgi:hypothetical protein